MALGDSYLETQTRRRPESREGNHLPVRALPVLLTADETADLLRTTRRAIYAMVERRQLPGVVKLRRRVLIRTDDLLHWLEQKPSPEE
jgi:excisionase family DNA binding protein